MPGKKKLGFCGSIAVLAALVGLHWTGSVGADTTSETGEETTTGAGQIQSQPVGDHNVASSTKSQEIEVPPPPFSEDVFPCMDCHEIIDPNPERRPLEEFHEEILLNHDEENRWCLDCHDAANRDVLRLASGKTIPFERSYLLCAQCHGPKFRDWKGGVHGKRMGRWDGKERSYLLCVHCHNPHDPTFPHIEPMPKPEAPHLSRENLTDPLVPLELPEPFPKRASGIVVDE